jgi:phosphoesterase RecJ-like protein
MTVTPQTNTTLAEIAQVIRAHDNFVLCGHMSPDGDCLGSQLTLWHALKAMGKRATCVLVRDEPVGSSLSFLPGMDEMVPASTFDGVCEVFIGLDVPTRARIGEAACAILDSAADSITVDHHASETTMCNHVYVDPDCAAASMLVWELVKLLVDEPPLESASCAYVGLMTDTGGFRFQNADSAAFDLAARLVANGVDPSWAATNVFQTRTIPSLKLEGIAIDHMRVIANGKVSLSWVDSDDMKRVGASKTDVEPLIDSVRAVEGTMVACLIREQDGRIRGNLRAKDDTDVSALARELGGGGHRAAAGFTLDMPIGEAIELMERKLTALFE